MFTPQPMDLNALRKLAGLPEVEDTAETPAETPVEKTVAEGGEPEVLMPGFDPYEMKVLAGIEEGIKDKVGDTPHGIPGPSGGEDELLDEVDEDEDVKTDEDELEEEAEEEVESGEEEIAEEIVGELNNGYKKHHVVDGDDYFPTGQDQSVSDEAGPASAKHGDNPLQKKIKVQVEEGKEIHRNMVYEYREFVFEADNRMRELNDEHTRLIQNLLDAKARNDERAIVVLRRKLADNENELERLNLGS